MSKSENLLVVIHLSATAVYVVVGDVCAADKIRIKGVGEVKTEAFQQGQIKHFDRLKSNIKQAILDAEEMANCRIHSVWLTLATPELVSTNAHGTVKVTDGIVETRDIVSALSNAKQGSLANTHYLMHHCQQGIFVDTQEQMIDDAISLHANELTVAYHLMMMPAASRNNIQKLIQACDVSVDHMLFDAVSTAEYSLMPNEREEGVCLIDIGASTTSICVYKENKLIFTHCIAEGGTKVTMDISAERNITMAEAEKLKLEHGTVDVRGIDPSRFEVISRPGADDEITINLLELAQIIEARYVEIYRQLFQELADNGLIEYIKSVVLAGGGSQIEGMVPFSKRFLNLPILMTNSHAAIEAYDDFDSDDKIRESHRRVRQRVLQTAYGALLYSQSEQFRNSEKSSDEALNVSKLVQIKNSLSSFLKNII